MKKTVRVDERAKREFKKFPGAVQAKFKALFEILETKGKLEEPDAKKLSGRNGFFEIRIEHQGQWRAIYAYFSGNLVIILSAFRKKTQKTPIKELQKAKKRLQEYI